MPYNWSKYTVLIAEDDPINFKYLHLLLDRRTGVQIIWAKDGKEAYEKTIKFPTIDIVLLDLQLPELNGMEVLELIKKACPDLPVVMQTANSWNNEEEDCYKLGCKGFFTKPLNVELLFEHMDKCILEYQEKKTIRQLID